MYTSMKKIWFTIWKEAKKQLLRANEDNFRNDSFKSEEQQESVSNASETVIKSEY